MKKFTLYLKKCVLLLCGVILLAFTAVDLKEEDRQFIHQALNRHCDLQTGIAGLKRFEINVTNTGFCRFRKVFDNGKQEYFAFNLAKFKSMDYYGTTTKGELYLRTKNDDVIVQTRNDKAGDIDSMGTYVVIPLKDIDVEQLNMLSNKLTQIGPILLANTN